MYTKETHPHLFESWIEDFALPFAKEFEKLGPHFNPTHCQPYCCASGKLTVLHGHVVKPGEEAKYTNGMSIAEATKLYYKTKDHKEFLAKMPHIPISEAEPLLRFELWQYWMAIKKLIKVPLKPFQQASVSEFAHNAGVGNFSTSTFLKKLNAGDYAGACAELPRWNKGSDPKDPKKLIPLAGLSRRRRCTQDVFNGKPISYLQKVVNWYHGKY